MHLILELFVAVTDELELVEIGTIDGILEDLFGGR